MPLSKLTICLYHQDVSKPDDRSDKLAADLSSGLHEHDISHAITEAQQLQKSEPATTFHTQLAQATEALHKNHQLPGFSIVGVDGENLLLAGQNNQLRDLTKDGTISAIGLQNYPALPIKSADPPSQVSYDPSTNTEYYNVNIAANQTGIGIDATMAQGSGLAAEAQTQIGKVNLMYEHDLGDKGQDVWISTGVGNGGNNILEASVSNSGKPQVVYMASFDKKQFSTLSVGATADGSFSLTFRKRL